MKGHGESVDVDNARPKVRSGLAEYERSGADRPPFILTTPELKLLGIAGVGFFLDGELLVSLSTFINLF